MAVQVGIRGEKKFVVSEDMLASRVGSGLVNVFATPSMIAAIENNVSHVAATPLGMEVRVETELMETASNGRVMTFKVTCYDEAGLIGEGTHQRAVVDRARFESKAAAKLSQKKAD